MAEGKTIEPAQILKFLGTGCFALALLHAFSCGFIHRRLATRPGLHWLSEVEYTFPAWAFVFAILSLVMAGPEVLMGYLRSLHFGEVITVFILLVVCSAQILIRLCSVLVEKLAALLPFNYGLAFVLTLLTLGPLLGSVITEPAAMTLTALIMRDRFFKDVPSSVQYGMLATLFVNISIGGVLTPFAAPPILVVAAAWDWDLAFVFKTFGIKAIGAVALNAFYLTLRYRTAIVKLQLHPSRDPKGHLSQIFVRPFLDLQYRTACGVALFLSGLIILGGLQNWWLEPLLKKASGATLYVGAMGLTALVDNAAITFLGTQVSQLSLEMRYALVAGAVVGGGLTIVANAPNPAGAAILAEQMEDFQSGRLLKAAAIPTAIAASIFWFV